MNAHTDTPAIAPDDSTLDVINRLLADLGTVVRRTRNNSLSDEDFEALMGRSRARLKHLRDLELIEEAGIELTDSGNAVAQAQAMMKRPGIGELFRSLPELMTGRQLAERPFEKCPSRMRMVGHLGVVK